MCVWSLNDVINQSIKKLFTCFIWWKFPYLFGNKNEDIKTVVTLKVMALQFGPVWCAEVGFAPHPPPPKKKNQERVYT